MPYFYLTFQKHVVSAKLRPQAPSCGKKVWTLKKKTKLKMDLIVHFADLEPLEQENVESFTAVLRW